MSTANLLFCHILVFPTCAAHIFVHIIVQISDTFYFILFIVMRHHDYGTKSQLAKNCAASEASLYSAFKKPSDVTLNHLRNKLLLEKAKYILITTDKPIEYISDLMQFSSTSYFRKSLSSILT